MKIILLITNILTGQSNFHMEHYEFHSMQSCLQVKEELIQQVNPPAHIKLECIELKEI